MIVQLFPVVVLVGLLLRWRPVFWLLLIQAAFTLIEAVAVALNNFRGPNIVCGTISVLVAFGMVVLVLQTQDDFFFDHYRIHFRTDRECRTATDFFAHAGHYSRRGMWALTALHLERAVGMMPDSVDGHLALSSAYIKLERFDRAADEIETARKIRPDDPQVAEQADLLARARSVTPAPVTEERGGV